MGSIARRQSVYAVAGCEDERQTKLAKGIGNRIHLLLPEIDVENSGVDRAFARGGETQPFLDRPGDLGDDSAKIRQHFLDEHRDQWLVLDDEYPAPLKQVRLCHHAGSLSSAPR